MTDVTTSAAVSARHDWASNAAKRRVKSRYAKDRRLQMYGIAAIGFAMILLGILITSLFYAGYVAFSTTKVELGVYLDSKQIDPKTPEKANYRKIVRNAFLGYFPNVKGRKEQRNLLKIISSGAPFILRDYVVDNPDQIGKLVKVQVPVSDPFDQLYKGVIPRQIDALSFDRIDTFEGLRQQGVLSAPDGRTVVKMTVFLDPERVSAGQFSAIANEAFKAFFPQARNTAFVEILGGDAAKRLQAFVEANPDMVGKTAEVSLPISTNYDNLFRTGEAKVRNPRFASDNVFVWFDALVTQDLVSTPFTWELFFNADSRFPELAGLAGAISGSALALLVCFLISFPVGIAGAIYLEEFAPKNRYTDIIEVNINNLAAVPSVVFGLLGLAVFLNVFGLPRSAPIVGGMVLSLMTLPTIIVATRAALKAVPPSIREAALGVGASKHQMVLHHVLPLALPGILTGTIIGLAQALGETAPLLLIGMNAFIPSVENIGIMQPATALPTQIFAWADSPERGFVSRTSAAILVLLGFLAIMNAIAIFLRQRFERKW